MYTTGSLFNRWDDNTDTYTVRLELSELNSGNSNFRRRCMSNENVNNPEEEARNMDQEDKDQILQSYDKFINYLGNQVNKGEKMGMDEDQLAKAATKVADYLAASEEPRNREEQVLKELWKATENDDEKKTVAKTLVRMAQKTN